MVKKLIHNYGFILSSWRSKRHPLECSCLESPMEGGAWWAVGHGVTKSWTRLSNLTLETSTKGFCSKKKKKKKKKKKVELKII